MARADSSAEVKENARLYMNKYRQIPANRADHNRYARIRMWNIRVDTIAFLGGKCVKCGLTDPRILQIHHKNGDGYKEKHLGPSTIQLAILTGRKNRKEVELLCANCNLLADYESGRRGKDLLVGGKNG